MYVHEVKTNNNDEWINSDISDISCLFCGQKVWKKKINIISSLYLLHPIDESTVKIEIHSSEGGHRIEELNEILLLWNQKQRKTMFGWAMHNSS